jgi:hypothetical protein
MGSASPAGDASYAAAGVKWRWRFAKRWTLESGLGVAVHDGATSNPFEDGDPQADVYRRTHQMLGARAVFHDTLALERRIDERRSIALTFEHLSNGGAPFGHDENQSLNEIGLRCAVQLR